ISAYPYGVKEQLDLVGTAGTAGYPWQLRLNDAAAQQEAETRLATLFPIVHAGGGKLHRLLARLGLGSRVGPDLGHVPLLGAFLAALDGKGPVPVPPLEARKSVELCTAIYTSALTRETVELPLDASAR